jgi:septal ring factor EnvC (AmiA/AmiB activator)
MRKAYVIYLILCCLILSVSGQKKVQPQKKAKTTEIRKPAEVFTVQELERQRHEALKEIDLATQLLSEINVTAKASINKLNLLIQQLTARRRVITLLNNEITLIDRRIDTINKVIEQLDKDLKQTKDNYAKSLNSQRLEYRTTQHKLLVILSASNFSQSYRRMRYLKEYADWQKTEAARINKKQEEITLRKAELEKIRAEKQTLLTQREEENKKLVEEEKIRKQEVNEINKKKQTLNAQLQKKKREAEALNRKLDALIAEDIRNSGKSDSADGSSGSGSRNSDIKTSSSSNYVMSEKELHLSNDFASNRGRLPYPLTSRFAVVSRFGTQQHQELTYVRTNNNGIDIQTTEGTDAHAVFNGVVTRVFLMPGFNNSVIIRHGNYLTVYSNLIQVYVKAGDRVTTRQPIGKIFTDKTKDNETILHFQIWKERTKLNPEIWLRKR